MNRKGAAGVDQVSMKEYGSQLAQYVRDLVARLKQKRYRTKLVRRCSIPKGNGKLRPLGIPTVEDRLLQTAVAQVLSAIHEADFLPQSYGYRPGRGSRLAIQDLTRQLQFGRCRWVLDCDVMGFFDNIPHLKLLALLEQRVADRPFLALIWKWLKAGVLEETGTVVHPDTGTPQGGVVSPVLANIYLHHVLDLWFEQTIKPALRGQALLVRYADDFVLAFEHEAEARRIWQALAVRLQLFGLSLSPDKTRLVKFNRFERDSSGRFEFLGFELSWGLDRQRRPHVDRRTARSRLRSALRRLTEACRGIRSEGTRSILAAFNQRLRGHWEYYGVIGNFASLRQFFDAAVRILHKWLNRRSQKASFTWKAFVRCLTRLGVERPRITESRQRQLPLFDPC